MTTTRKIIIALAAVKSSKNEIFEKRIYTKLRKGKSYNSYFVFFVPFRFSLILVFFVLFRFSLLSQNIAINGGGTQANTSALLDVGDGTAAAGGDTKGLLIPRVALTSSTDALTIATP